MTDIAHHIAPLSLPAESAGPEALTTAVVQAVTLLPALPPADPGERYGARPVTAGWLLDCKPNTRRAYYGDLALYLAWCEASGLDPLQAKRVDVTAWKVNLPGSPSTIARRLSAVSSWYRYLTDHDVVTGNPVASVRRPAVNRDVSPTTSLDSDQAARLLAAADAYAGRVRSEAALRAAAMLRLMLTSGLRVGAVVTADVRDYTEQGGHRVLRYQTKGDVKGIVVVPPPVATALDAYLAVRAERVGVSPAELAGPLFVTLPYGGRPGGKPLDRRDVRNAVVDFAEAAGLEVAARLSPHSLRHTVATILLGNGVPLADVQDLLDHADPRTTRRYDAGRGSLDRSPAYALANMVTPGQAP